MLKQVSQPRNRPLLLVLAVLLVGGGLALAVMLWAGATALGGSDITAERLTPAERLKWLNDYSPVAVPDSATDIEFRYTRFTDWHFSGSFTLPAEDFERYVAQLRPGAGSGTYGACDKTNAYSVAGAPADTYHGVCISGWEGTVTVDRANRRVRIVHFST